MALLRTAPVLPPSGRTLGDSEYIKPVRQVGGGPDLTLPALNRGPEMEPVLVRILAVPHQRTREMVHLVQQGGKRLYVPAALTLGEPVCLCSGSGVSAPGVARPRGSRGVCGGPDESYHRVAPYHYCA